MISGLNEPQKVTELPGEVNYQKYSTRDSASMANGDEDGVVHDLFSLLSSEDRNFLVHNNADQVNHTQKLIISDKVFIFMFMEIGEEKKQTAVFAFCLGILECSSKCVIEETQLIK